MKTKVLKPCRAKSDGFGRNIFLSNHDVSFKHKRSIIVFPRKRKIFTYSLSIQTIFPQFKEREGDLAIPRAKGNAATYK